MKPLTLLSLTDGKNQTTRLVYDEYGRVTNKIDQAGKVGQGRPPVSPVAESGTTLRATAGPSEIRQVLECARCCAAMAVHD